MRTQESVILLKPLHCTRGLSQKQIFSMYAQVAMETVSFHMVLQSSLSPFCCHSPENMPANICTAVDRGSK